MSRRLLLASLEIINADWKDLDSINTKRPQHLHIRMQVCPLEHWDRIHDLNIQSPLRMEWIRKLIIHHDSSFHAFFHGEKLVVCALCVGVDKCLLSVAAVFTISHNLFGSISWLKVSGDQWSHCGYYKASYIEANRRCIASSVTPSRIVCI